LVFAAQCGLAQTLPQTTDDALHAMLRTAGVIFTGTVIAVRRHDAADGTTGVVEIDFAVEDAVRGVSGPIYTLREWAGLWPAGDQPFCAGQRFLMLLYAPGVAGLSSPVGGMDGAIPLRGGQTASAAAAGFPVTGVDPKLAASMQTDSTSVDLRWVATRVFRRVSYRPESPARPTGISGPARANTLNAVGANSGESAPASSQSVDLAAPHTSASTPLGEPYATVLAKLRAWEREDDAAR
jgi:hypothetical protein